MDGGHHVVIVGGGFGGLRVARELKRTRGVRITLIDRRNFHLFQPLLYQVATGGLSPANIASPLRGILKRQKNVRVRMGDVTDIDAAGRCVLLRDGEERYDTLVVATGVRHTYFGNDAWEPLAPGLKTIEDATEMRRRILSAFEAAEHARDPADIAARLTVVIVGGGPTGVELAGALAEIARDTMRRDFRAIDPAAARIVLVEGLDRVLSSFPENLSARAAASLRRLGVTVRTTTLVTDVRPDGVTLKSGDRTERLATHTVLWAAGVQASPMGAALHRATGVALDRAGRVMVEPDLTIAGHPEIFVIGDLAHFAHQTGRPLPGVAPVAMQQGEYVARVICTRLNERDAKQTALDQTALAAFRYRDPGSMATIGRAAAVADFGRLRLWGYPAWLAWLFVHLMNIVAFENRVLVFTQWAWNYFTRNRSARLITGEDEKPRRVEGS